MSDVFVTETEGRSYVTRGILLLVNAESATAQAVQGQSELVIPGLLPIYRTGTNTIIGYGAVKDDLTVRLFLDYSTPERLELETGAKKYLLLVKKYKESWCLEAAREAQHLELTDKTPDDERVLPVGAPELALY